MIKKVICFLFFVSCFSLEAQEDKKGIFNIKKLGFLYNYGTEENFIFNDKDYAYSTNTYKAQVFYNLGNWKDLKIELIVQPQVQYIKHQLLNEWFVTPDQENYKEKIAEFIQQKNINLYALEFGFAAKKKF